MEFFLKSIGVTDEVMQHLDQAELTFQRPVVFWIGMILLFPVGYFGHGRQAIAAAAQ